MGSDKSNMSELLSLDSVHAMAVVLPSTVTVNVHRQFGLPVIGSMAMKRGKILAGLHHACVLSPGIIDRAPKPCQYT